MLEKSEYSTKKQCFEEMLQHDLFNKSAQKEKILRYLFEQEILNESENVNELSIATDALDLSQDFDPTIDSVVRAAISRTRQALSLYEQLNPDTSYIFSISTGSYRLNISKAEGGFKKIVPRTLAIALAAIASVVVIVAYSLWLSNTSENGEADTFRPVISVSYEISDEALYNAVWTTISQELVSADLIYVFDSPDPDYQLIISQVDDRGTKYGILVEIVSRSGKYIYSKSIKHKDSIQAIVESLRDKLRYEAIQETFSVLPLDYASAEWVDPDRQRQFNCSLDTDRFFSYGKTAVYLPEELPACLSDNKGIGRRDAARKMISHATLAMQQARGYFDLGISKPLETSKNLLDDAEKILGENRYIVDRRIYLFWAEGIKDPERVKEFLKAALKKFGDYSHTKFYVALTYSLYMGDVSSSRELFIADIPGLRQRSVLTGLAGLPLTWAIIEGDAEEYNYWITRVPEALPYLIWDVAIACKDNRPVNPDKLKLLEEKKINDLADARAFIERANYHHTVTNWLVDALASCRS